MLDTVLVTKLNPPRSRSDWVPRPRLVERIESGAEHELLLVSAPAGAGKTSALVEWAAHTSRSVAWLSLDAADSDPARFLAYVVAALRTLPVAGHLGQAALAQLAVAQSLPAEAILTSLINEVAEREDQIALVLDDYHLIDAAGVHAAVAFLVEHVPENATVLIAGRSDPPLPLARLRLRGDMAEIRSEDLSFTVDETAALLRQVPGAQLSAEDVAILAARTEGWVAGLQAAALSLRGRDDVGAFVASFAGSHRYLLDYLDEEVVDRQPVAVREFLLQTAILDRLCGPLCDAVTGNSPGQGATLLETLEHDNLFIAPLDDERRWYRYHQLFADLLRHRLQREQKDALPELHRRASVWFEGQGLGQEAVQHALAAGDEERAARLIEELASEMLVRRESAALARWLGLLSESIVRSRPRLCVIWAWATLFSESLTGAEDWLKMAEVALAQPGADPYPAAAVRGEIAAVRARIASWEGDVPRTIAWSRVAMADLPPRSPLRVEVALSLGVAHHMGGEVDAAIVAFEESVQLACERGREAYHLTALCMLAEARRLQGRLRMADDLVGRALALAASPSGQPSPAAGRAYVVLGEIRYEQNELGAAEECARQAIELGSRGGSSVAVVSGHLLLAQIRDAAGDLPGALAAVDEVEEQVRSYHLESLQSGIAQFRASLQLTNGQLDPAVAWAREYVREGSPTESGDILFARISLAEGRYEEAAARLEQLLPACRAAGRGEREVRILVLLAMVEQARGDTGRALEWLTQALDRGAPEGFVRSFVSEGQPMAELLRVALSRGVRPDYAGRLLPAARAAAALVPAAAMPPDQQPLVEPLSDREMEVLRLVAAGYSNHEIAEELVIAVGTVKRHITNINGKLEVGTRARATARARELGLIV